jgi:hypothetical protein
MSAPGNVSIVPLEAEMATLCIDGGKKAKMRPGDVLGALTGDMGLDGPISARLPSIRRMSMWRFARRGA